jgi:hypothetical protein
MRAIKNLLREAELVTDSCDPAWPAVWGAEVLGRAIGHELRWELDHDGHAIPGSFRVFVSPPLDSVLVGRHIADVL